MEESSHENVGGDSMSSTLKINRTQKSALLNKISHVEPSGLVGVYTQVLLLKKSTERNFLLCRFFKAIFSISLIFFSFSKIVQLFDFYVLHITVLINNFAEAKDDTT